MSTLSHSSPHLFQCLDLPLILVTFAWHDWRCKLLIYHVVIISHAFYFVNQHSHLLMWWQTTSNREIKIHVYAKWQMSDSSWEILRIENKQIKTVQNNNCSGQFQINNLFLCIKLAWNYLFFSWSNKHLTTIKGKTWSHGTNSRLVFGVNVNLYLSNVKGSYSCPLHHPAIRVSPLLARFQGIWEWFYMKWVKSC